MELLPALREEFNKKHGEGTLERVYIDKLNEDTLTHLPYNRRAGPFLVAYFISAALNKPEDELNKLLHSFAKVASQKGGGNDGSFTPEILDKIVEATENIIDSEFTSAPDLAHAAA